MEQNIATPLLDHWSYSSMSLFLRNRLIFKKRYIEKIYDDLERPSGIVGKACHKFVEVLLRDGLDLIDAATQEGLKYINSIPDIAIEYGKTGSREKILEEYHKGIGHYIQIANMWLKRDVLEVEKGMTETIHDEDGNALSIPAKCYSDVIWRSTKKETFNEVTYPKGSLFIEDHKFVRAYSDPDVLDPARMLQAMFNFHIIREKLKEEPVAMLYNEVKLTENKDKTPQAQYYVVDFAQQRELFPPFYKIYNDVSFDISKQQHAIDLANRVLEKVEDDEEIFNILEKLTKLAAPTFLPNFFDMFDGDNAYLTYRQNLLGVETPVAVAPKTKQLSFVEQEYVPSTIDKKENEHLNDEERIRLKLQEFGMPVEMRESHTNGAVVLYTMRPNRGIKMSAFENRAQDIALALKANSIRVQAPIMGTDLVGVEIPAHDRMFMKYTHTEHEKPLTIPLGRDVYGNDIARSLADMPHLLVAGATGSGKSVFLINLIDSLIKQHSEHELALVLIDPKRVELARFKGDPHLLTAPIYDTDKAILTVRWLVDEMESRYKQLESSGHRDINAYNLNEASAMKYIVLVVDEMAEMMLVGGKDVETPIVRLAQMARAVGIHLVVATQRPTVDVVTGLIKANMPTRVCLMVSSRVESQIILDEAGGEQLSGKGDMLVRVPGEKNLIRAQGYNL